MTTCCCGGWMSSLYTSPWKRKSWMQAVLLNVTSQYQRQRTYLQPIDALFVISLYMFIATSCLSFVYAGRGQRWKLQCVRINISIEANIGGKEQFRESKIKRQHVSNNMSIGRKHHGQYSKKDTIVNIIPKKTPWSIGTPFSM